MDSIKFKSGGEINVGDPVTMEEVTLDYRAPVPLWTEMVLMQAKPLKGFTPPPELVIGDLGDPRIIGMVQKIMKDDDMVLVSTDKLPQSSFYGKSALEKFRK